MTPRNFLLCAIAAAAAAACASTPPANEALDQARAAYRGAQSDPHVTRYAPAELDLAGRSLNHAEALWRNQSQAEQIAHQAYLAEQQARIARQTAMLRAAEEEVAQASTRRERAVLEARALAAEAERDRAQAERERSEAELRELQVAREAAAGAQQSERLAAAEALGAELRRLESQVAELDARQTDRGWVLSVGNHLLFDVGESTLKPGGRRALDNVVRFLREHPERSIVIEGFTDSTGSSELNRYLSERRAQAVRNALVLAGIDAARIEARGLGASFPIASNDTIAGRQLNRRVEILIPRDASAATGGSR
jgi:outer membrane protein OmpA-like peptidoglycan-associated protein